MVVLDLFLFILFLLILVKSADYATRYSSRIAKIFGLSEFIVSFFIVAVISAFPEGTLAIMSAIKGIPEFGLGALLGSNVADLALVFGIVALVSFNGISVRSEILKKDFLYLALLLFPVILGLDGHFSRTDGVLLVLAGVFFFFTLSFESKMFKKKFSGLNGNHLFKNLALLILSLVVLVVSANYTIKFGIDFAYGLNVPAVLIGLTVVSIGSCLPELFFSVRAVYRNRDALALGDVLGTVIIDATILVGVMSLIRPFYFNPVIIYVTGMAMFIAGVLAMVFINTGRVITRREGFYLLLFYFVYLLTEIVVNRLA